MKMNEVYGRLMETAIIVSEVFQNLIRSEKLDEDSLYSESETETFASLCSIAEDIEDELSEMNEDERDRHGIEDIREWAEERILKEYGCKEEHEATYKIRYIEYYEGFYYVKAKSYDEAVNKLKNDINIGKENGPEQCYHSEFIAQGVC